MHLFKLLKNNIKIWLTTLFFMPLFLWCFCDANDDLLWQIISPAYYEETIIGLWKNVDTVWKNVFKWATKAELGIGLKVPKIDKETGNPVCRIPCPEYCAKIENNEYLCKRYWKYEYDLEVYAWLSKEPSLIVKITRMLLVLTIALSVTMILYNGMMYIIKTWQWKEGKDVIKNIAYIVVWILIALFSVIIIRVIQSIPSTLGDNGKNGELPEYGYQQDKDVISQEDRNVWVRWRPF